jgi:glutamyl-tRNA(Gln) amidotransferase subunit E
MTTLQGLIHSDENLPGYGFSETELEELFKTSGKAETDAMILLVGPKEEVKRAVSFVVERTLQAFEGVPNETREVDSETGTSRFTRELPGKARLYPDTDSEPVNITSDNIEQIKSGLPDYPWVSADWIVKEFRIPEQIAGDIVYEGHFGLFKEATAKYKLDPTIIAITLTQTMKALARDHIPVHTLTRDHLQILFHSLSEKTIAKEAISDVLTNWAQEPTLEIDAILEKLGLTGLRVEELGTIIKAIVEQNQEIIKERGMQAFAPIMGDVMKEVRGKIDGKTVSDAVRTEIQTKLKEVQ